MPAFWICSILAAPKSVDRSTLAHSILREALRGVVISLRGALAVGGGEGHGEERPQGGQATSAA